MMIINWQRVTDNKWVTILDGAVITTTKQEEGKWWYSTILTPNKVYEQKLLNQTTAHYYVPREITYGIELWARDVLYGYV